jgi:hypothetical protein
MSGDWIKMRGNLWDDPRVSRLVDLTESSESAVVGALYWIWATADQHSEDGIMPGLTLRAIDRKTGLQGFSDALITIGWLADHPEGVRILKFDEHNGESAKKRCQTAKRVAKFKGNNVEVTQGALPDEQNSVSGALPRDREEKKEEKDTHTAGASLPEVWMLTKTMRDEAIAEFPHWTAEVVLSIAKQFADHHRAAGTQSCDWDATWRKWCRDGLTQRAHPKPKARADPLQVVGKTVQSRETEATQRLLAEQQRAFDETAAATPEQRAAIAERLRAARAAIVSKPQPAGQTEVAA